LIHLIPDIVINELKKDARFNVFRVFSLMYFDSFD
jgi:hypothetical protein